MTPEQLRTLNQKLAEMNSFICLLFGPELGIIMPLVLRTCTSMITASAMIRPAFTISLPVCRDVHLWHDIEQHSDKQGADYDTVYLTGTAVHGSTTDDCRCNRIKLILLTAVWLA